MSSNFPGNNKKDSSRYNKTPYGRPSRNTDIKQPEQENVNSSKGIIHNVKESVAELLSNSWLGGWITPTSSRTRKSENDPIIPQPSTSQPHNMIHEKFLEQTGLLKNSEGDILFPPQGALEPLPSTSKDTLPSFGYASSIQKFSQGFQKNSQPFISSTPAVSPATARETLRPVIASTPILDDMEEVSIIDNPPRMQTSSRFRDEVTPRKSLLLSSLEGGDTRKRPRAELDVESPQESALASKRPRFNLSATGSFGNSTLQSFNNSSNSIFYPGKTMYGGASNYRRSKGTPNRILTHHKIKPTPAVESSTSDDGGLSLAAKKILDCLEKMTTPLSEAKRIPASRHRSDFLESPSYIADFHKHRPNLKTPGSAPPTSKLLTPSQATIKPNLSSFIEQQCEKAKAMEKEQEASKEVETLSIPNISKQVKTPVEQPKTAEKVKQAFSAAFSEKPAASSVPPKEISSSYFASGVSSAFTSLPKSTPAMLQNPSMVMSKSTKPGGDSLKARVKKGVSTLDETPLEVPDLPKVTLPVSSIPKISFNSLPTLSIPKEKSNLSNKMQGDTFQFSEPEAVEVSIEDVSEESSLSEFIFSEPLAETGSLTPARESTCKIIDSTHLDSWESKFQTPKGSWECSTCCVMNGKEAATCIACGACNPTLETPNVVSLSDPSIDFKAPAQSASTTLLPSVTSKVIGNFGNLFKKPAGEWECQVCLVNNKQVDVKCVACQTVKPGSESSEVLEKPAAAQGFDALLKKQSKQWECQTCMIHNSNDVSKCIACETPKDGRIIPEQSESFIPGKLSFNSKGFSDNSKDSSSSAFKFGVQGGTASISKTVSSISSFGATASTPAPSGFNFGVKASESTSHQPKVAKPAETTTGFSFGVSPSEATQSATSGGFSFATKTTTPSSSGFSFGVKPDEPKPKETESVPHVPKEPAVFSFGGIAPKSVSSTTAFGAKFNGFEKNSKTLNNNLENKSNENTKIDPPPGFPGQTSSAETFFSKASSVPENNPLTSSVQSNGLKETSSVSTSSASSLFSFGMPTTGKAAETANFSFGRLASGTSTPDSNIFGSNANSSAPSTKVPQDTPAAFSSASNVITFGGNASDPSGFKEVSQSPIFPPPEPRSIPSTFSFGQTADAVKPATGVFAFGAPNNNDPKPSVGFNFGSSENSSKVNLTFGQTPDPAAGGLMQFRTPTFNPDTAIKKQPTPAAAPNAFSITTANPFNSLSSQKEAPQGRVIRKAFRRTRK